MQNIQIVYPRALDEAVEMLEMMDDLEIRSALKQAAWDNKIENVSQFVKWAESVMFA